jgi:hypothetical protein
MRTSRFVIVPLVVLALLALYVAPAAAQNTFVSLRYWSTQTSVSLAGGPAFRAYDTPMFSLSIRRVFAQPWSLSFNIDAGGQSNWAGTWAGATTGGNTHWNANLHRDFRGQNTNLSLFLGYAHADSRSTFPPIVGDQKSQVNGLRAGADFMLMQNNWHFKGWGAVGLGMSGETSWPGFITASGSGTYSEFGALVGYMFNERWGLEGGYRWLTFSVPGGVDFLAAEFRTSGFTIGVKGRF